MFYRERIITVVENGKQVSCFVDHNVCHVDLSDRPIRGYRSALRIYNQPRFFALASGYLGLLPQFYGRDAINE
jgi:hypothetical protein